jgi:hypothetical protein
MKITLLKVLGYKATWYELNISICGSQNDGFCITIEANNDNEAIKKAEMFLEIIKEFKIGDRILSSDLEYNLIAKWE